MDIGRNNGDTSRAVDDEAGYTRWQNQRFLKRVIVVWAEIYRLFVDISEGSEASFAMRTCNARRRSIAVDTSKVALAVMSMCRIEKGCAIRTSVS